MRRHRAGYAICLPSGNVSGPSILNCLTKKRQCPCKPGSVLLAQRLSFIYLTSHPVTLAFYPPSHRSWFRAGYPQSMVYMNLQLPDGTARRSPDGWWSLTPPSHPYPLYLEPVLRLKSKRGGCFLLPTPTVTNSFYFRKWDALRCPDFPLVPQHSSPPGGRAMTAIPATDRSTVVFRGQRYE